MIYVGGGLHGTWDDTTYKAWDDMTSKMQTQTDQMGDGSVPHYCGVFKSLRHFLETKALAAFDQIPECSVSSLPLDQSVSSPRTALPILRHGADGVVPDFFSLINKLRCYSKLQSPKDTMSEASSMTTVDIIRRRSRGDGDTKKRRLSEEQVELLERSFNDESKLETGRKDLLAAELGLDGKQVAVWFQNRRARQKNKKVEEAYGQLKSAHDAAVAEKWHLENEVLNLKLRLWEAEDEIRKLLLGMAATAGDGSRVSLPSSAGDFRVLNGEAGLMFMHEYEFNDGMPIL
ncbi:hypothetical protein ZIOFF_069718 [Zingiber officinale]|uniref:Homeobox-leucine zipper protein n=2 Tax=Zingiber officinale TaxID=94328 RepID=A0A8J5C479_ZINOF|nr:hypothetical protein ZIOFF_069718 [Zingiber officinale]